jgi:heterodisulfide reductase subunit C
MGLSKGLSKSEFTLGQAPGTADEVLPPFCIQCGTCSVFCPMIEYMDYSPRVLNAMLMAGRQEDVLRSRAIWACTGCYACTVECPKQLPVTESIYALKRTSMRAGVYPRRFITPVLARQFVRTIARRGRSSEAWISLSLYLRTRPFQLLKYAPVAVRLMLRGRLPLRPESVREPAQLRRILAALDTTAGEDT